MEQNENKLPLSEQLFWAERHAADPTIAEHNRNWFKAEAERMRAVGITPTTPKDAA